MFPVGYFLGGMLLAGLPIVAHLIMRQKPKVLPFPALRFLLEGHRTNRRRLQIQHLLLLLLRILIIVFMCLALARPPLEIAGVGFTSRPIVGVFIFDTTPSMGYTVTKRTRLEDAKARARELLKQMNPASRIAIYDCDEEAEAKLEDLRNVYEAQMRVEGLNSRYTSRPLQRAIKRSYELFRQVAQEKQPQPQFLFVFSDRTRASWDASLTPDLKKPEGVQALFLDVGATEPRDLAIESVEVEPAITTKGGKIQIRVTVRATGAEFDNELTCQIDNDPDGSGGGDRIKTVKVAKDATQTVTFERTAPNREPTENDLPYQVSVRLGTPDALPFNNTRYATFLVRKQRQVLAIAENRNDAHALEVALNVVAKQRPADGFDCTVLEPKKAEDLTDKQWGDYKIVFLFQVAAPSERLVAQLASFVKAGGGLVIVPAGQELDKEATLAAFNERLEKAGLLPAALRKILIDKKGVPWAGYSKDHALTATFHRWKQSDTQDLDRPESRPIVNAYWELDSLLADSAAVAQYADEARHLAIAERKVERGKVVLLTTTLDGKPIDSTSTLTWNNYFTTWFGLVLMNEVSRYLAGDMTKPALNFPCGPAVSVALPRPAANKEYKYRLSGPELSDSERMVSASKDGQAVEIKRGAAPGNYLVYDEQDQAVAGVSLNIRGEESDLSRVPEAEIEPALGERCVVPLDQEVSLQAALQGKWTQPLELTWVLLLLGLLAMVIEGLIGNKWFPRVAAAPANKAEEESP